MVKVGRMAGEIVREISREKTGRHTQYSSDMLVDAEDIKQARKFAVQQFVALGKIDPTEVGEDGLLGNDPFLENSTFFGVRDAHGELSVVARLIWNEGTTIDDMRLPTDRINPEDAQQLLNAQPGQIAEFGSLAKLAGISNIATLKLIREVFSFAKKNDIETIVCGLEPKLYPAYCRIFGGALRRLHPENIEFPGIHGEQVPLMINVKDSLSLDPRKMYEGEIGQVAVGTLIRLLMRQDSTS
jgi:hypothetical protein